MNEYLQVASTRFKRSLISIYKKDINEYYRIIDEFMPNRMPFEILKNYLEDIKHRRKEIEFLELDSTVIQYQES